MNRHETINYIELPAKDLAAIKVFFTKVFDWKFTDYGAEYIAFSDEGLDGGFYQSELISSTSTGSVLVVFYSDRLEDTYSKIQNAGGKILQEVFTFPGGRRFHFSDPHGNEYAVWAK